MHKEDHPKSELVKLRYFAGMSVEEAASAMGISQATASRHWTHVGESLRDLQISASRRDAATYLCLKPCAGVLITNVALNGRGVAFVADGARRCQRVGQDAGSIRHVGTIESEKTEYIGIGIDPLWCAPKPNAI